MKTGANWESPAGTACYSGCLDPRRQERVSTGLREELEELINYELSDPRVGGASVAEVLLSPDFKRAHVRLLLDGTSEEQSATLAAIDHAKQFLRHQLASRLLLFHTPDLHFEAALPATLVPRGEKILRRIRRGRPKVTENTKENA